MNIELQTRKTQVNRNGEPSFDKDLYYDLDQFIVTCLSREVDWFICLDECHWSIDFDLHFPDFF